MLTIKVSVIQRDCAYLDEDLIPAWRREEGHPLREVLDAIFAGSPLQIRWKVRHGAGKMVGNKMWVFLNPFSDGFAFLETGISRRRSSTSRKTVGLTQLGNDGKSGKWTATSASFLFLHGPVHGCARLPWLPLLVCLGSPFESVINSARQTTAYIGTWTQPVQRHSKSIHLMAWGIETLSRSGRKRGQGA